MAAAVELADRLRGRDLRSIGEAGAVSLEMLRRRSLVDDAVELLSGPDPVIRARAADALEKASRDAPAILAHHKRTLLALAAGATQQELRWHLAQVLPRLPLDRRQRVRVLAILRAYMTDRSRIVQVCAMQALWDLTRDARPRWIESLVRDKLRHGPPSLRARARLLLAEGAAQLPRRTLRRRAPSPQFLRRPPA